MAYVPGLILGLLVFVFFMNIAITGMAGHIVRIINKLDTCGSLECAETVSTISYVESGFNEAIPGLGTCVDNCMRFFCRGQYAIGASDCTQGSGLVENTCPSLNLCSEECALGCTGGNVTSGECITPSIVTSVCPP